MVKTDILQLIADLEKATFTDNWSRESIEDTLKHTYNFIYVAWKSETGLNITKLDSDFLSEGINKNIDIESFAGYLIANAIADETELLRIAVKQEMRGKGIAGKLIETYFKDVEEKCSRGLLEVRKSNLPARALYEKKGYNQLCERKNYYKDPVENGVIYEKIYDLTLL